MTTPRIGWLLIESDGSPELHAADRDSRVTYCGLPASFPLGSGHPNCATCLAVTSGAMEPPQRP